MIAWLAATGDRDGWDWLLYGLSVATAIFAIVGFAYWILDQRRLPEVSFSWLFAANGERSGLVDWPPDVVHELRADETALAEIAVFNAGDRAGTDARWNFVVELPRVWWRPLDVWFDNIFSDLSVHDRIRQAEQNVVHCPTRVEKVRSRLDEAATRAPARQEPSKPNARSCSPMTPRNPDSRPVRRASSQLGSTTSATVIISIRPGRSSG